MVVRENNHMIGVLRAADNPRRRICDAKDQSLSEYGLECVNRHGEVFRIVMWLRSDPTADDKRRIFDALELVRNESHAHK